MPKFKTIAPLGAWRRMRCVLHLNLVIDRFKCYSACFFCDCNRAIILIFAVFGAMAQQSILHVVVNWEVFYHKFVYMTGKFFRCILSSNSNNCCLWYFNANIMCSFTKKASAFGDFVPRLSTRAPPLDPAYGLPSPRPPVFFYVPPIIL